MILTVLSHQALKVLRTAEFAPYVVFIAAPTITPGISEVRNQSGHMISFLMSSKTTAYDKSMIGEKRCLM